MAEQRAMAAISNAVNLLQSDSDDDDFSRVVQQTRRSFRRAASSSGRKKKDLWKKKILLLKRANADFFLLRQKSNFYQHQDMIDRVASANSDVNITDDDTTSIQRTATSATITVDHEILSSEEEVDIEDIGIPIISDEDTMPTLLFNRDNVVQEMFEHYKDENLPTQRPQIIFEHETGADCGGLTKEVYTIFFSKIEESYFAGENVLIPFLPLHRQRRELQKYVTIGTILDHCVCLTKSLPIRFSKSFLLKLGNADAIISDEILLDDFLKYVTVHEANFLKKGLNDFNQLDKIERNDLISFFTCYKLYENPSPTEFCEQILSIAKENLIVKPTNLIDEIRKGIHPLRYELFWSKLNLKIVKKLLSYQKLTPEKVIEIIRPFKADLTNEEQNILYYLHMYIRSLSCDALQQLVFFITGSYTLPDEIIITFTTISGLMIRPISHTCSNTLELSICYNTYQEFKRNLNIYLGSEYSYQYTQL
ncbi:hypothetical protein FQR65_LT00006 [Abscondita terminalis]|nr:hypothetical protein FQR65_LT00006 [Abscondita terminalis]